MRLALLATILAAASVYAQTPVNPNTVPTCVQSCSVKGAKAAGCINPLQTDCVCNEPGHSVFLNEAANCLIDNCITEINAAVAIQSNLCAYGVDCQPPFTMCGTLCIDPSADTCVSGVPTRRGFGLAYCKPNEKACRVPTFGIQQKRAHQPANYEIYECIDVMTNLEACGGCPDEGGEDCSTIFGALDVACIRGRCVVAECEEGMKLHNGRCR